MQPARTQKHKHTPLCITSISSSIIVLTWSRCRVSLVQGVDSESGTICPSLIPHPSARFTMGWIHGGCMQTTWTCTASTVRGEQLRQSDSSLTGFFFFFLPAVAESYGQLLAL